MVQRVRVLIADDRCLSRGGLRALLGLWPQFEVIGEATNGQQVVDLVQERRPDVVVMDVQMPGMNGLQATEIIKREWPEVRVIVLTTDAGHRGAALAAGADAFMLKGGPAEDLAEVLLGHESDLPTN